MDKKIIEEKYKDLTDNITIISDWDYYVNFEKIYSLKDKIEVYLKKLDVLIGEKECDINKKFIELLEEEPNIRLYLPLLIACRISKFKNNKIFIPKVSIDKDIEKELLYFFEKSGLKNLYSKSHIESTLDYYLGVEVGIDSNCRKNRTGILMENIVECRLIELSNEYNFKYIKQANYKKIEKEFNIKINEDFKRFDFVILNNKQLIAIEVNYYNTDGSKFTSIAEEYIVLSKKLNEENIKFVWITDGYGIKQREKFTKTAIESIENIINIKYLYSDEFIKLIRN